MSVFDWDDHCPANNAMPWMAQLKELNPAFKATLFSIPGVVSDRFWESHPDWVELACHGYKHPDAHEAEHWTYEESVDVLLASPERFVELWKSPGWLTSDGMYQALRELGWSIADQHLADDRRPFDLPVYLHEDGENWHGHVQDVCGNGLHETWGQVCEMVSRTTEFRFASEAATVQVAA